MSRPFKVGIVAPSGTFSTASISSGTLTGVNVLLGSQTYAASGTPFYANNSGSVSIGNKLTWNGSSLSIGDSASGAVGLSVPTNPSASNIAIYAGASGYSTASNAPFKVDYAGNLFSSSINISGGSANFTIGASISGSAIATTNFVTGQGYAQLASANFTAASVGGNPIYTLATAPYQSIPFSYTGTVAVYTSSARFYNDTGGTRSILSVRASVGTAPTGSAMIVDVRKNDIAASATIFTASGITIAASTNTISATTGFNSGSSIAAGDYLTVAIKQVGSTVAGADLSVVVNWR